MSQLMLRYSCTAPSCWRASMTGWSASQAYIKPVYRSLRREVRIMTAYEIISIFIGILALLMSFGSLIVAFLAFLDKRNKKK